MDQLNFLKKQNEKMKNDLKTEKFPEGSLVYVIDYTDEYNDISLDENEEIYRIGRTENLKTRKTIYNTHLLHKRPVVHKYEIQNPIQLETCIRAMLQIKKTFIYAI